MSKILRALIISAYSVLLFHLVKFYFSTQSETIELDYLVRTPGVLKQIRREIKKNKRNSTFSALNFTKPYRLPTDYKYILKWTIAFSHYTTSIFKNGQEVFVDNNCSFSNCFLTNDKSLLIDLRHFDAILFDVENNWDEHPPIRAPHQLFIFTASESAANYPICGPHFEDYYNITWTYKLDSDIRWSYISIFDKNNNFVGPKINMSWIRPMLPTSDEVKKNLASKKKTVAWFVSNCYAEDRLMLAKNLERSLAKYNMKLDMYGWCGNLTCPRDRIDDCLDLLKRDYYFYLAFENSFAEDYVTEKILYPLMHYTVPIVYGGADYSRFLPPASYINAVILSPDEIVSLIIRATNNRSEYEDYFRWHNHYEYREYPEISDVCSLCALLNTSHNNSIVRNFRQWWNPNYESICEQEGDRFNI